MDTKEIEEQLQEACKALLLIPLDDLEAHDEACQKSESDFVSFAPVLSPADYFTKMQSGELDFIKQQNAIAHKLREVRRLIAELPMGAQLRILGARTMEEITAELYEDEVD